MRLRFTVLLALLFHGPLVLAGFYLFSYDVGTHGFFADHYIRSPFGLWDPRWFAGFSASSYPPLAHQLVAAAGAFIGIETAFGVVLLTTLVLMPVAVHGFARQFVGDERADAAAVVSVFLPAIALTGHNFGQLPTLVATVIVLFLAAEWRRFIDSGERTTLVAVAALAGLAFAAHHATPVLMLPVAVAASFFATSPAVPLARRLTRALIAMIATAAAGAVAALPFLVWDTGAPAQVVIPHLSRANFLLDADARALFFWGMYGVLPAMAVVGLRLAPDRRALAPASAAAALGVLGLGGTTALPELLFGPGWEWLTYDRFAMWSAVMLLPLAGNMVHQLLSDRRRLSRIAAGVALTLMAAIAAFESATPLRALPASQDLDRVASFLNEADRATWRYQTFGFGDASTRLAYRTEATTIDGAYFTARAVPELQASGIGMLDYALWWDPTGEQLRRVLASADRYGIRWALVAETKYEPFVLDAGFAYRGMITRGVALWENADAPALAASALRFGAPDALGILWGTAPASFLALAGAVMLARRRAAIARRGRSQWELSSSQPVHVPISPRP